VKWSKCSAASVSNHSVDVYPRSRARYQSAQDSLPPTVSNAFKRSDLFYQLFHRSGFSSVGGETRCLNIILLSSFLRHPLSFGQFPSMVGYFGAEPCKCISASKTNSLRTNVKYFAFIANLPVTRTTLSLNESGAIDEGAMNGYTS
jgi:hypothetical protein